MKETTSSGSGKKERLILAGMISDKSVLGRISIRWDGELFASKEANTIATLCIQHYHKTGEPPRKAIINLFEIWGEKNQDQSALNLTEKLLSYVLEEGEQSDGVINPDLIIDMAGEHFHKVRLSRTAQGILDDIYIGQLDRADAKITGYTKVALGVGGGTSLFQEKETMDDCFADNVLEPVVKYPGDLGLFLNDDLVRDAFVAVMAPQKFGKSYILMDIAYRALKQRKKVAYFQVGDMSQRQVSRRFYARNAVHPLYSPGGKWPYTIKFPKKIIFDGEHPNVETKDKTFDCPLNADIARKACQRLIEDYIKSKESYFKLFYYPTLGVNVDGIKATLQAADLQGFTPDCVVIDYADNLAPPSGKYFNERDPINLTWAQLRAISESRHCLMVTATQVNAKAYGAKTIGRHHFAGDNRKFNHVTAMYALNMTSTEKERGLCRLNCVVRREGEYVVSKVVHVAQCLALANPAVLGTFPPEGWKKGYSGNGRSHDD